MTWSTDLLEEEIGGKLRMGRWGREWSRTCALASGVPMSQDGRPEEAQIIFLLWDMDGAIAVAKLEAGEAEVSLMFT